MNSPQLAPSGSVHPRVERSRAVRAGAARGHAVDGLLIALLALVLPGAWSARALAHEAPTFEHDVRPILTRSCGGTACHIDQRTSGVELTTYGDVMRSSGIQYRRPIVVPFDPAASPLYDKIANDAPEHGARMPRGAAPLSETEIDIVREWIRGGAIENDLPARGDIDRDGVRDLTDAVGILEFLFREGPAPGCRLIADVNLDGTVDISDAVHLLLFLFAGGAEPPRLTEAELESCEAARELSFDNIFDMVLSRSCAFSSCHSAAGRKGNLVLESIDAAYEGLVGTEPFNEAAREAGLLRIEPGRPDDSFLMRKLLGPGPGEGNRMPASSPDPLPETTIALIREWILAGAPREGTIDGVPAISETPSPPIDRVPQPPVPENGVQLHLPAFPIAPHGERQLHWFAGRPFADLGVDEVFVRQIDVHMLEQSHHFILYRWIAPRDPRPGYREGTSVDVDRLRVVVISQQSFFSLRFPEGVGMRFDRDEAFDLNSHYVNLNGSETLWGEVYINIFFADPDSVKVEARPIFDFGGAIFVPPFKTTTARGIFPSGRTLEADPRLGNRNGQVARPVEIYALTSHTHRHGRRFTVDVAEGGRPLDPPLRLYENTSWDDPVFTVFEDPLLLAPGQGLLYEATYTYDDPPSPSSPALRWGPTSEDEMIILLGYYGIR